MIKIIDNSGAQTAQIISYKKNSKPKVGAIVIVTVKHALPNKRVDLRRQRIYKALLVRCGMSVRRPDGSRLAFQKTSGVLLKGNGPALIGSRIKGPVLKELRVKNYLKVISLASIAL